MRIKIEAESGKNTWLITPLSGLLGNKVIARVDGITLSGVSFEGGAIYGTPQAVWGLEALDPMMFNDPLTVKGLGIGRSFNMLAPTGITRDGARFVVEDTGERVAKAKALWILGAEMKVYGVLVGPGCDQRKIEETV